MPLTADVTLIQNPAVPAAAVERVKAIVSAALGPVEVFTPRDREEGDRLARRAAKRGARTLVALGGDGTVQSVLGACLESGAALGVVPLGTANDLAGRLGLTALDGAARAIARQHVRRVDAGLCAYVDPHGAERQAPFVTTAGAGVLAEVARQEREGFARALKNHLKNASWPVLFAKAFACDRGGISRLSIDGENHERPLALLEICKVPAPGGFTLSPGSDLDTGALHAWYFGGMSLADVLVHVARAVTSPGGHLRSGKVSSIAGAQTIALVPRSPLPVQVNGDWVGTTPATFTVLPRALRVLVPPNSTVGYPDLRASSGDRVPSSAFAAA